MYRFVFIIYEINMVNKSYYTMEIQRISLF